VTATSRTVDGVYEDPLDLVWKECAAACGYRIARSAEVYASFDGENVIRLSTPDDFDADDSLAQMILHELCHALVAGPDAMRREDWGLDNTSDRDLVQEHATHRLQAHLADRWGMRGLFAVTTVWRDHWDRLGRDPLAETSDDPAIGLARAARVRADAEPFASAFRAAFAKTAVMADLARGTAGEASLWRRVSERVQRRHRLGFRLGPVNERCGTCAWGTSGACEMASVGLTDAFRKVRPDEGACLHWEPVLDDAACGHCGACCHVAFHLVPVGADEPVVTRHPGLVTLDAAPSLFGASPFHIARPGGFCVALIERGRPYRCSIYEDRPQSCRDFEVGSANCLEARRRVGLSPRP
jgi:hypothetical protein